jgi:hypothetical protein
MTGSFRRGRIDALEPHGEDRRSGGDDPQAPKLSGMGHFRPTADLPGVDGFLNAWPSKSWGVFDWG